MPDCCASLSSLFGWNAYAARCPFLCRGHRDLAVQPPPHLPQRAVLRTVRRVGAHYVFAMCGGFAVNYSVYAALYYHVAPGAARELGVAARLAGGLTVNYLSSRWWIYRHRHPAPPAGG